jgi:hypothetical protein
MILPQEGIDVGLARLVIALDHPWPLTVTSLEDVV